MTTTRARSPPASPATTWTPCKQDCFFDGNSGAGDDGCQWDLRCDSPSPDATACRPYATRRRQVPAHPQSDACRKNCGPHPQRLRLLRLLRGAWQRFRRPPERKLHGGLGERSHQVPALHAGHLLPQHLRDVRGLLRQARSRPELHPAAARNHHRHRRHRWWHRGHHGRDRRNDGTGGTTGGTGGTTGGTGGTTGGTGGTSGPCSTGVVYCGSDPNSCPSGFYCLTGCCVRVIID